MKAILRRWWRQLTSMRTALVLLLFLAVAAIPGSLLPQRSLAIEEVRQYFTRNPKSAPTLDKLWLFDVYSSPWFAAIYLLLFTSLVGCLIPRFREHIRTLRKPPPDAPARMSILPHHRELTTTITIDEARHVLKRNRFRVVQHKRDGSVTLSGEKGYLREAGNLLFHFSLLAILVGVALGALYGWNGNRILVEGEDGAFCNTLQQYDEYGLGPNIDATTLPPFCLQLDSFTAKYLDTGSPTQFTAHVQYGEAGQAPSTPYTLEVNHPLELDGASVFLLGHGYAPVISYTDRYGVTQTTTAAFLAEDGLMTSSGAAIFPDANVNPDTGERDEHSQVAFEGLLLPTAPDTPPFTRSVNAEARNPGVILIAYRGDTGLDDGQPKSVYSVDKNQIANGELDIVSGEPELLMVGDSWELDDGTVVTFEGLKSYAVLQVNHDPGEGVVLAAAIAILLGLIPALTVKRRRFWVRFTDGTVEVGGLTRTEYEGFTDEFEELTNKLGDLAERRSPEKIGTSS